MCVTVLAALMVLVSACGKKGPPTPLSYVAPPVVADLQISCEDNMMTLQWPIPEWEGTDENALAGFYVYRSQIALSDTGCEDCPVRFKKTADIRFDNNKSKGTYAEPVEKGFRYSFKVSAYIDSGYEGEKSDVATIDY
jgi:hypothetical protein